MKTKILTALTLSIFLAGCNETSQEKVKTVEYYQQNKEEHTLKIKECKNNLGELRNTPNCINAFQASKNNSSGKLPTSYWGNNL